MSTSKDPEPKDENDPAYKEEMFQTFKSMRLKPEELTQDTEWAAEYGEWLKQQEKA